MYKRANLAKGELSAQLLIAGSSLVLEASQGTIFPATGSGNIFTGMIWGSTFATPFDDTAHEIVTAYRSSGDTFTIVRAQEGTNAKQWEIGDNFMLTMTSAALGDLVSETTTSASSKATPVDADTLPLVDSAASNVIKSLSWANLKAALLTWLRLSTTIIPTNAHQGFLINGKIVPSVASSDLTVAIKTLAGTDPSSSDPVYVRIGDTVRPITSALSVTKNDGTNWFNAGSAELATKEIDYFVYLGYNATDGVVIGFSRIPYANQYGDFSTTTTNEKYCAISTITTAASTDYYENIGRFAATLSAGAGYTWTVPTFTAANLIQRPIYTTNSFQFVPTITVQSGGTSPTYSTTSARAIIQNNKISGTIVLNNTSGGTAGNGAGILTVKLPFSANSSIYSALNSRAVIGQGFSYESGGTQLGVLMNIYNTDNTQFYLLTMSVGNITGNDQSSADRAIVLNFDYEI